MERNARMMKSATVDNGIDADIFAVEYNEYMYFAYGIKVVIGTMREWFLSAIENVESRYGYDLDDAYWKWAERTMSEHEFYLFCKRQEKYVNMAIRDKRRLKRKALCKGYITPQEYAIL